MNKNNFITTGLILGLTLRGFFGMDSTNSINSTNSMNSTLSNSTLESKERCNSKDENELNLDSSENIKEFIKANFLEKFTEDLRKKIHDEFQKKFQDEFQKKFQEEITKTIKEMQMNLFDIKRSKTSSPTGFKSYLEDKKPKDIKFNSSESDNLSYSDTDPKTEANKTEKPKTKASKFLKRQEKFLKTQEKFFANKE